MCFHISIYLRFFPFVTHLKCACSFRLTKFLSSSGVGVGVGVFELQLILSLGVECLTFPLL